MTIKAEDALVKVEHYLMMGASETDTKQAEIFISIADSYVDLAALLLLKESDCDCD